MAETAEREARKALNRMRRTLEKGARELEALEGALRHAEGGDFPGEDYEKARDSLQMLSAFLEEEATRLEEKILVSGGLESGRIRRSSG